MPFAETARAKLNLTLKVLGRRADGYHEIESLVAFAAIGDRVTLTLAQDRRVTATGRFARDIDGPNLLEKALRLLRERDPQLQLGSVVLDKNLPVAAGLGGGSADAAGLLRAVRRANPERAGAIPWQAIAAELGADVPVCLAGMPALISGIGERVELLGPANLWPSSPAVVVNPGLPLPTAKVYQALAAGPVAAGSERRASAPTLTDTASLVAFMAARGNDLERPALSLLPAIADVKARLAAQPGCRIAAMSGSGPTCFGLFVDDASAARAAAALAAAHPRWWVVATQLIGSNASDPGEPTSVGS